jgi:hypothetical protein
MRRSLIKSGKSRHCSAHILNENGIVVNLRTGRAEDNDAAVGGIVYHIIPYHAVATAHADSICPLLKLVRSGRTNVIVLNGDICAVEVSLDNVQTRPASWIPGMYIFNELIGVGTTKLDVRAASYCWCASTGAIDLRHVRMSA